MLESQENNVKTLHEQNEENKIKYRSTCCIENGYCHEKCCTQNGWCHEKLGCWCTRIFDCFYMNSEES